MTMGSSPLQQGKEFSCMQQAPGHTVVKLRGHIWSPSEEMTDTPSRLLTFITSATAFTVMVLTG
jgi:hypothetical protein